MTDEQTLVKVFTEVFKSLGELQRIVDEGERYLEEKDV